MNQEQLNTTIKMVMKAYQIGLREGQGHDDYGIDIATFIGTLIDKSVDKELEVSPLKPMAIKVNADCLRELGTVCDGH